MGAGLFAPNSETTRAQLVTILHRLAGQPAPSGDSGFSDVETGTWYTDAVAWAAQNGIVNGVSDTQFAPGDDITREQLAVILYRYATYQGYDVSQRADLSGFVDAGTISTYAQEALSWANAQGLVLGFEDDSLRPQGNASRPRSPRYSCGSARPWRSNPYPGKRNGESHGLSPFRFAPLGMGLQEQLRRLSGARMYWSSSSRLVVEVVGVVKVLGAHGAVASRSGCTSCTCRGPGGHPAASMAPRGHCWAQQTALGAGVAASWA